MVICNDIWAYIFGKEFSLCNVYAMFLEEAERALSFVGHQILHCSSRQMPYGQLFYYCSIMFLHEVCIRDEGTTVS